MGWSRMTGLAIDRVHTHETHKRWYKPARTERLAACDEEWGRIHDRARELAPGAGNFSDEYIAAVRKAEREFPEPDWIAAQCGGCRFYVNLEGGLGADWGVCTNAVSQYDRTVKFEHDGCNHHAYGDEESTPERLVWLEGMARIMQGEASEVREELKDASPTTTRQTSNDRRNRGST